MPNPSRENRMLSWLDDNPYEFYPHSDDQLSSQQIDYILDGDIESFDEDWWSYENNLFEYADWDDIEKEFTHRFNLPHLKAAWPLKIRELFDTNKRICSKHVLEHCLTRTPTQIAVKPIKQSGNYIEFPNFDFDKHYNRYLNRYNKKYLGIENSWDAETCYYFDVLTINGSVDLKAWYEHGRKPDFIKFGPNDFALTHNFSNGSGGLGDVEITKERKMRADFRNDTSTRYGVQSVFGFISSVWKNELNCVWS